VGPTAPIFFKVVLKTHILYKYNKLRKTISFK